MAIVLYAITMFTVEITLYMIAVMQLLNGNAFVSMVAFVLGVASQIHFSAILNEN